MANVGKFAKLYNLYLKLGQICNTFNINDIEAPKALDVQLVIIGIVVSEAKSLEREYWQKRKLLHGCSMGIYAR